MAGRTRKTTQNFASSKSFTHFVERIFKSPQFVRAMEVQPKIIAGGSVGFFNSFTQGGFPLLLSLIHRSEQFLLGVFVVATDYSDEFVELLGRAEASFVTLRVGRLLATRTVVHGGTY